MPYASPVSRFATPPVLAAIAALCAPADVVCDTLEMKDGRTIDGEITERGDAYDVKTKYGTLSVPKDQVLRIVPPAGAAGTASTPPEVLAPPIAPPATGRGGAAPPSTATIPPAEARAAAPAKRLPEPDAQALKEAVSAVRALFQADYAKRSPEDLAALAAKLHQAGSSERDAALRYACFQESLDAAVRAGDVAAACRAIDSLAEAFDVDVPATQAVEIERLVRTVRTPEAGRALAAAALAAASALMERDAYDPALKALATAGAAARAAKDAALSAQARADEQAYRALRTEYRKAEPAFRKLESAPDDPAANRDAGTYLCLAKGNWETGLPHLAKGDDAALKALAVAELATPAGAADRLALADGWHQALSKLTGHARERAAARALMHYRNARPGLPETDADRAAARAKELEKIANLPPVPPGAVLHLSFDRTTLVAKGGTRILRDQGGNGLDAALTGGTLETGVLGEALRLDGGFAVVPESKALDLGGRAVTIACWVRFDKPFAHEAMILEHDVWGNADAWQLTFMNSRTLRFNFPALHAKEETANARVDFQPGAWHHVAATYDGKSGVLYVDGRKASETPATTPLPGGTASAYVGSRGGRGLFLPGALDELIVYPRALRSGEVGALHEAGRAGAGAR